MHKNIFGLEISMEEPMFVHVCQGLGNLKHCGPDLILCYRLTFVSNLCVKAVQVLIQVFKDEIQLIRHFDHLLQFDDVLVVELS